MAQYGSMSFMHFILLKYCMHASKVNRNCTCFFFLFLFDSLVFRSYKINPRKAISDFSITWFFTQFCNLIAMQHLQPSQLFCLPFRRENVFTWCCWWRCSGAQRLFLWLSLRWFPSASSQHWEFFHPKKSALSTFSKPTSSSSVALWWHHPLRSGVSIAE